MTSNRKKNETPPSEDGRKGSTPNQKPQEGVRETVEAVAIAFILAFVFKTFEAEAFVIPTGSMAPTLYGRHKEITCSGCSYHYTVGASQEIDQESGILNPMRLVRMSTCPNCRYLNDDVAKAPVFNGDRIVVNKQVKEYKRFDVVVFKNPEEPHVNYIKRLVGLPGETVRIRQGDIQARRSETEPWVVQRKADPEKQRDIQLLVYDDNHPPKLLLDAGAEERWAPAGWDPTDASMGGWPKTENAWKPSAETRTYAVDANDGQTHWLRYRNLVADDEHWDSVLNLGKLEPALEPQLIADFCGFNAENSIERELYWINDLTLDCTIRIETTTENAKLTLELVEGFRTVRCSINPVSGMADIEVISREDGAAEPRSETIASVQTEIRGAGEYRIEFADVDDRLCLWVDGDFVPLGEKAEFQSEGLNLPTNLDLAPAGIAATGLKAVASNLMIRRDIYYRNDTLNFSVQDGISVNPTSIEYAQQYENRMITVSEVDYNRYARLATALRTPENYAREYATLIQEQQAEYGKSLEFPLADDEYLMFGDNSPASKDSRLFDYFSRPMRGIVSHRHAVKEQDLIGEALCIFWPHGIPFMNGGKGYALINHKQYNNRGQLEKVDDYPLYSVPFYPNISRMKMIR